MVHGFRRQLLLLAEGSLHLVYLVNSHSLAFSTIDAADGDRRNLDLFRCSSFMSSENGVLAEHSCTSRLMNKAQMARRSW